MQNSDSISDDKFNHLALRAFHFQFESNKPYRRYCERRGVRPAAIGSWAEVPAVPTAAFKAAALMAGETTDAEAVFRTSGTTRGKEQRGAHYVADLEMYRRSLLPTFRRFVLPDVDVMPIASLISPWSPGGESSLAFMADAVMLEFGTADSINVITGDDIDHTALEDWLSQHEEPVCLLGTSLAFVHWFDDLRTQRKQLRLAHGSRLMDTGGFKGSTRSITSTELREQYSQLLGIEARYAVNEYGMTEMLSQFYDAHLREPERMNVKQGPPWVRSTIVDPETLKPLPHGQTGLLRHFDLANLFSVSAIQTEDLGRAVENGFELLGRVAGAAPRGCSIAMDMFLSGAQP